jgi:hypothetical protein
MMEVTCVSRIFHLAILLVIAVAAQCTAQAPGSQSLPNSVLPNTSSQLSGAPSKKAADPKTAFDEFAAAYLLKADRRAADFVSKETLDRYDRCRLAAIDSTGMNFNDFTQLEVMLILQFRYLLSKDELQGLTGRELFCWAIRTNLANAESINGVSIDGVQIDGDIAFATLSKDGVPARGEFSRFVREEMGWKFDLSHTFDAVEHRIAPIRQQAGKSKIEFAVFLMERKYKEHISPDILRGPLRPNRQPTM